MAIFILPAIVWRVFFGSHCEGKPVWLEAEPLGVRGPLQTCSWSLSLSHWSTLAPEIHQNNPQSVPSTHLMQLLSR